jgi:membrane protease YdiL (CAAX protease family)
MRRPALRRRRVGYFSATRHPWPCTLFVLPLLAAYEGGVLLLGEEDPETLRNGADAWLRSALAGLGLPQLFWAPALLVALCLLWCWVRYRDCPRDLLGVCIGMAAESVAFALGLWGLSRGLGPLLDQFGIQLELGPPADQPLTQIIGFVGAGIYEEMLFRLLLFSFLVWGLRLALVPRPLNILLAALGSATLFSAAHHLGPYGEDFDGYTFLFRTLAGVYFALLYQLRGFGIAVGAHAGYDVLVGVLVDSAL